LGAESRRQPNATAGRKKNDSSEAVAVQSIHNRTAFTRSSMTTAA
jgi:hypothetical protein